VACKDEETSGKDKDCLGCGRARANGRSWYNPEEQVEWLRGRYCVDCHTLHRRMHSSEISLVYLGSWLQVPTNKQAWNLNLLAFASLAMEKCPKISIAAISERANLLKWVLGMLGIPLGEYVVQVLSPEGDTESTTGAWQKFSPGQVDPRSLLTVVTSKGPQLGFLCPRPAGLAVTDGVPRPTLKQWPEMVGGVGQNNLYTVKGEDAKALQDLFGVENSERPPEGQLVSSAAAASPSSKLGSQLLHLVQTCQEICGLYALPTWDAVKESAFTTPVNKLASVLAEGNRTGDLGVTGEAEIWLSGMQAGKQFVKTFREFSKTKTENKTSKRTSLEGPLNTFLPFLRDQVKIRVHIQLAMLGYEVFRLGRLQPKRRQRCHRECLLAVVAGQGTGQHPCRITSTCSGWFGGWFGQGVLPRDLAAKLVFRNFRQGVGTHTA